MSDIENAPASPNERPPYVAYETHAGGELWLGDALELIPKVPEFSCVFIDPPYCSGGRQTSQARNVVSKNSNFADGDWIEGDNMGSLSYIKWIQELGSLLYRGSAKDSELFIMTDHRQLAVIEYALEKLDWTYSNLIVWIKAGGMGSRFQNMHELVMYFKRGRVKKHTGTFNYYIERKPLNKLHPNEKPIGLIKHCIKDQPGGLVLDPTAGSASTVVAALQSGYQSIGIERNAKYMDQAKRRMKEEGYGMPRLFEGDAQLNEVVTEQKQGELA